MVISLIVAVSENHAIGMDNKLIWHLPNDLKLFKKLTMGHHMIMGRKTFESIGKPLPGRTTIIVTRNYDYFFEDCIVVHSLELALEKAKENNEDEVFIIGGAELFNISLAIADKIYLTKVKAIVEGDTFFQIPESDWQENKSEDFKADERHEYDYSFIELSRKK